MTSVRGRDQPAQRGQTFKAPTDTSSSNKFDNRDHENPLGSNKLGPFKALAGPKAPLGPSQAPPLLVSQDPGANRYIQQDLDRIFQMFFHSSKGRSGNKFKAKTLDICYDKSHLKCYKLCQQCEDHFATCGAFRPNQILFAAFFLQDQINFCWQQHKRKLEVESSVPISWDKFKVFLWKALGDS